MAQTVEQPMRTHAALAHGTLLAATRHGTVVLLDAATGARLWQWTSEPKLQALAHGGDRVYVLSVTALPITRFEGREGPVSWLEDRPPRRKIMAYPAMLTALLTRDGTVLWQQVGWSWSGRGRLALDSGVLVTDALASEIAQAAIVAFDPETGARRWEFDTGGPWGIVERLVAARGGRAFAHQEGDVRHICALDLQSSASLWTRDERDPWHWLSQTGTLIAAHETQGQVTVRDARDGSAVATLPLDSSPLALADDGVIFAHGGTHLRPQVVALRMYSGREIWRVDASEVPLHTLSVGDTLYCAWLTQPEPRAQVLALDTRTGHVRWRWSSPGNLLALLKLWGSRTPTMILSALAQARWSIKRARDTRGYRGRGVVSREVIHGQWRRPSHLVGTLQIAADSRAVYVGTSLGLFALRAGDGHLLWHALPTYDMACFEPIASPEHV